MSERRRSRIVVNRPHERQWLHRHSDARLILFLAGDLSEASFGIGGSFSRGDLLFRPAFFGHADRAGELGSSYVRLPVSPGALQTHLKLRGGRRCAGKCGSTT